MIRLLMLLIVGVACWESSATPAVAALEKPALTIAAKDGYVWRDWSADGDFKLLYLDGQLQGYWQRSTGDYFAWNGDEWVADAYPAAKLARKPRPNPDAEVTDKPTGVVKEKLSKTEAIHLNGGIEALGDVQAMLDSQALGDDAKKQRLTVTGDDRKRVMHDIQTHPRLSRAAKVLTVVKEYPPDHPRMKRDGFYAGGHPTIYLQAADGAVLGRNKDDKYRGPEQLAEAIEMRNKDYHPENDPNLWPSVLPAGDNLILFVIAGGVLFAVMVLLPKREAVR